MSNPFPILYEDRSGLSDYDACRRLRWWSREVLKGRDGHCGGVQPARQSIYLLIGTAVHHGMNWIMEEARNRDGIDLTCEPESLPETIESAASIALATFDEARAAQAIYVPDAKTLDQEKWKIREARALVEGLVIVAGMRLMPNLLARFKVVEVEREKRFTLTSIAMPIVNLPTVVFPGTVSYHTIPGTPIVFESRADALLEERDTGDLHLLSWKTSGDYGKAEEMQFRHDVQGLSEAVAIEATRIGGEHEHRLRDPSPVDDCSRVQGIQMALLLKGRKSRDTASGDDWADPTSWHGLGPGLRFHYSPITHGWRMASHGILPGDDQSQWAWANRTVKPVNKSGFGKLAKGWEEVAIFDHYPGGTRQWLIDLMAGRWQPELGDPLEGIVVLPETWPRSDREMEDWQEEAKAVVQEIHPNAQLVRDAWDREDWPLVRQLLNRHFKKTRAACGRRFGSMCWAADLCWGTDEAWQEPLALGQYILRQPHHSLGSDD
jgi:hypothetical protein